MIRALRRTFAVAAVTLLTVGGARLLYIAALCPRAELDARMRRGAPVVVDNGYRYARPGEAIFTCTTQHLVGPLWLHEDFDCYCAPAGIDPVTLGRERGGTCEVEILVPSRTDEGGICRHAHCAEEP